MLHIIKHPRSLAEALLYATDSDDILLLEDAVYTALPEHKFHALIVDKPNVFCLLEDAVARGLKLPKETSQNKLRVIDFAGFVDLTAKQAQSLTWD
ncbi:sulfurtransferase complex subunit TusB [Vibrio sp. TH_r3]|uniref:sulfurtransferase complex subunit TusB n=1 Tax=Vibrio sp. TH_r3 TaxID=3082084 RepID=UPI00295569D9|nr:sulfurtransferase complex subunit TusB [Vibrio sp. TH_r3]MDV7105428.1 sulfurtransferase complex subunit TusB [Vibrio sp. TH_r3]